MDFPRDVSADELLWPLHPGGGCSKITSESSRLAFRNAVTMSISAQTQVGFCATKLMIRLMDKILHELIYLKYGIYGTILYLGHTEFCPSTVALIASGGTLLDLNFRSPRPTSQSKLPHATNRAVARKVSPSFKPKLGEFSHPDLVCHLASPSSQVWMVTSSAVDRQDSPKP